MNLENLRGWMKGEDCVVVGCGPSATEYIDQHHEEFWTMACNSAVRGLCDFAVCVEPRRDTDMWGLMDAAGSMFIFSHIDRPHPRAVLIGSKDVREWMTPPRMHVKAKPLRLGQSPFYAAAVAAFLGFETIGLIGVDLTKDRYPAPTGENETWGYLRDVIATMGSRLINLSPTSRLTEVEQGSWSEVRTK